MLPALTCRIVSTVSPRCLWKAGWNFGLKGMLSVERFRARKKRGIVFPPFLHLSIINSCNLRCQGCWVDVAAKQSRIEVDALDRLVADRRAYRVDPEDGGSAGIARVGALIDELVLGSRR